MEQTVSPRPERAPLRALVALIACSTLVAGCGGDGAPAKDTGAAPATAARGGAPGGRGGAGVVLAGTDVATIAEGSVEDAVAITGDLRPIETIELRSRLAGDVVTVLVREGDRVRAGQLVATIEASQQESARASAVAQQTSAEARLQTATWNAEQARALFTAGAIAETELRAATQEVAAAQAAVAAARAQLRVAAIDAGNTRLVAPSAGIVSRRTVQPGERVAPNQSLVTMVRTDVLELTASVPERQAAAVRPGLPVRLVVGDRTVEAKVTRVSPTVDPASRSITVYVAIPNANDAIKGNTFARGRVIGETRRGVLLVPTAAIRQPV
ncbi:MAG: efflux RND transporter periplasmic adaptor subunit, partial [Gemmatimonadaceae bacterium]|nr:efflux RND transporter periplasmic adaptor subunit [Gemmatimonadaceae bacterium]